MHTILIPFLKLRIRTLHTKYRRQLILTCLATLRSFGLDWSHLRNIRDKNIRFEHAVFQNIREYYGQYSQELTPLYIYLAVGLRHAKQQGLPKISPPTIGQTMHLVDLDYIRKDTLDATAYYNALFASYYTCTESLDFFLSSLEKRVIEYPAIDLFCLPNSDTDLLFFLLEGMADTAEFTVEGFNSQILCAYSPTDLSQIDYVYKAIERVCYNADPPFPLYGFLKLIQSGKFYEYNKCVANGMSIWDYCAYYGYTEEFRKEISAMLRRGKRLRRYFRGLEGG